MISRTAILFPDNGAIHFLSALRVIASDTCDEEPAAELQDIMRAEAMQLRGYALFSKKQNNFRPYPIQAQMKRILLPFLCLLLAAGCKKTDNTPTTTTRTESDHTPAAEGSPAFTIDGIHDVDLSTSSSGTVALPVQVSQVSGRSQETVSLSVFDLPAGVYASVNPVAGSSPFGSTVTFHTDYSGAGGDYIAHIQGGSNTGTLRYPLRITVPKYNGFEVAGLRYSRGSVIEDSGSGVGNHYIAMITPDGGARLIISFAYGVGVPKAGATFHIKAAAVAPSDMKLQFYDYGSIYTSTGATDHVGTFTADSLGKLRFSCDNVEISDGFHQKMLSANFFE